MCNQWDYFYFMRIFTRQKVIQSKRRPTLSRDCSKRDVTAMGMEASCLWSSVLCLTLPMQLIVGFYNNVLNELCLPGSMTLCHVTLPYLLSRGETYFPIL